MLHKLRLSDMQQVTVGSLKSPTTEDIARLATLSVVSNHLCRSLDTEELGRVVLETLLKAFEADRGFIHLFDEQGETIQRFHLDVTQEQEKWAPFQFTTTWLENCLTSKAPVLVIDTEEVAPTQSVTMTGIRSVMLSPLLSEQRLLGVIYLDSLIRAGCFEQNDSRLLQVIAEMVSVAVDRNLKAATVVRQSVALDDAEAKLEMAAEETIRRLSRAAEFRDGETSEHLVRVSEYCEALGRQLGLPEDMVDAIKIASLLHDVGKLGIPDSILLKPGRFTDYERQAMQKHTIYGAQILAHSDNPVLKIAEEIALSHHEKWDGSGYPNGMKKEEIPLAARIVAVADVFDAVTSARRYKESYSLDDSFSLLEEEAGSHFDPELIKAFLAIRPTVEKIWNENQEPEEGKQEEEPQAPPEEPKKPEQPESVEAVLEQLEQLPVSLAKNSKLNEAEKTSIFRSVDYLVERLEPGAKETLLELTKLANSDTLTFQHATKLAGLVGKLKAFGLLKPEGPAHAPSILVVDSDPYQREVLSTEATRRGMRVFEHSDLDKARACLSQEKPDLVVLELADTGAELFLEEIQESFPDTPILILSRDGELSRRLWVASLSNCSFLHKPVPSAAVVDEIEERLPGNDEERSLTVLALDDDKVVLKIVSKVLSKYGYRPLTARDPEEFWEMLTEHTPDLVLLDLEMPKVSGYEVCRMLRGDVKYRHLPIIVLTAHQELSEYQHALEAGADDVLAKPLQPSRLLSRIESRISRNRALQVSAGRDALTGLSHRRQALKTAEQMFSSALRHNHPYSVCMLEIEDFDALVEREGWRHSASLLRQVAEVLVRSCRPEDVITRCREHSLLLMMNNASADVVKRRVEGLNTKLGQMKGPLAALRCQARTATSPVDGTELKALLERVGYTFSARF